MELFSLPCLLPLSFILQEQKVLRTLVLSPFEEKLEVRERKKIPTASICVAKTRIQRIINQVPLISNQKLRFLFISAFFILLLPLQICCFIFFQLHMSQKISFLKKKKICDCPMKVIPLNTMINFKNLKTLSVTHFIK